MLRSEHEATRRILGTATSMICAASLAMSAAARAYGDDMGSLAGLWRVLPGPEAALRGEIMFSDRQFDGGAGCGRFWGDYRRSGAGFSAQKPNLEGDCPMEAEILSRLAQAERLVRRGPLIELLDGHGRNLLSLTPQ